MPKDSRAIMTLPVSAKKQKGISELLKKIEDTVKSFKKLIKVLIPYDKGGMVNFVHGNCEILTLENTENGFLFQIYADNEAYNRLKEFIMEE